MKSERPEVVVITGTSTGVGHAIARASKRWAHVGLSARGETGLEGARRDVKELGGKAIAIPTDVSDTDQVEATEANAKDAITRVEA